MNQQKYIMFGIMLLLVIGLVYLGAIKLSQSRNFESPSTKIDFEKTVNSSNANKIDGKSFFISKCAPCHNVFKNGVGPALSGLNDRGGWNDSKKLYNYIRDPKSLENNYVDSLRKVYGTKHIAFPDLSDEDIKAILIYINVDY
jgi:cytochrome c2